MFITTTLANRVSFVTTTVKAIEMKTIKLKTLTNTSPAYIRWQKDQKAYRIIIAGSRTFNNYALFASKLDHLVKKLRNIYIVTGDAKGPDKMATRWAFERGWSYSIFRAEWDKHGKAASLIRNQEMIEKGRAKALIAFWDGKSKGTKSIIDLAKKAKLKVKVIYL